MVLGALSDLTPACLTEETGGLRRAVLDWVALVSYPEAWGAPLGTLPALPRGGIPDAPVRVVASGVAYRI